MAVARRIRGATAEERKEARRKLTSERRAQYYLAQMRTAAGNPRTQLQHVYRYMLAVADDLPADRVTAMGQQVAEVLDRWNKS